MVSGLVVFCVAMSFFSSCRLNRKTMEISAKKELLAVVKTLSSAVAPDLYKRAVSHQSNDGEAYGAVRHQLLKVVKANHFKGFDGSLYVMRKTSDNALEQVVAVGENGSEGGHFQMKPHSLEALNGAPSVSKPYQNARGMRIVSVAAPLKDKSGHVMGIIQADRSLDSFDGFADRKTSRFFMAAVIVVIGIVLAFFATRAFFVPLDTVVESFRVLGDGWLNHRLSSTRNDEFGRLYAGFNRMAEQLKNFITALGDNALSLSHSSSELSAVSQEMSGNANNTSNQATVVSSSADEINRNIEVVRMGVDQMSASIREIAQSANGAAQVASNAVDVAERTNLIVGQLGESSAEIGNVIKVITSIAEQTNLLALNATIEAARAGEYGKGFAVVANEVKDLAKETAKATDDIGHRVEAIQADTQMAVEAISRIRGTISQISDTQNTIATAVEEQTATASEIARNVNEVSIGSREITNTIARVANAAHETSTGAKDTQSAAHALSKMADELQTLVSKFDLKS